MVWRINKLAILSLAFLVSARGLLADVSPIKYEGFSISPTENSQVEMRSEEVNIYCYDTCRVSAKFNMWNGTTDTVRVFVGFPIHASKRTGKRTYDFQAKFNGRRRRKGNFVYETRKETIDSYEREVTWVGWYHGFIPGETIVEVEYNIEPSPSGQTGLCRNIFYVLSTGSYWKGDISRGIVNIHFNNDVETEQIREQTTPKYYQVDGKRVYWEFTDLEPAQSDDIQLEYVPSKIYRRLKHLRNKLEKDPENEQHVVELARHLFAFGRYKGVGSYIPTELPPEEYDTLVVKIAVPEDRDFFGKIYRIGRIYDPNECGHPPNKESDAKTTRQNKQMYTPPCCFCSKPNSQYGEVVRILNSIDYIPTEVSGFVWEAKDLLEELLDKNPKNADAWLVYLSNYYRFRFSGYAPFEPCENAIQSHQVDLIKEAYRRCPSHKGTKLWYEFVSGRPHAVRKLKKYYKKYYERNNIYDVSWD
jgi:hypothetical protein